MLFRVALFANGFQIVPIQRYIRIVDVPRLDIANMVDYGSRPTATFANIVLALQISLARLAPLLAVIERPRVVLRHTLNPFPLSVEAFSKGCQ